MKDLFALLAGLLALAGLYRYGRTILAGNKPQKVSWLVWVSLDTVTFIGMLAAGTANFQIAACALGGWAVVRLALKYGRPGWSREDKACLVIGALGLVLWKTFGNPMLGVSASLLGIFIASWPTFKSGWKDPKNEDGTAWILFFVSCISQIAAVKHWTFEDAAQPIVFLAINGIMMAILFVRPRLQALPSA